MTTLISGALCLVLGIAVWFLSGSFPVLAEGHPGPSLFPRVISGGLALAGVALLAQGLRRRRDESLTLPEKSKLLRLLGGIAVGGVYPWLQTLVGTIPALSLSCLAVGLILGLRIGTAALTAAASGLLIYAVFSELLGVPL